MCAAPVSQAAWNRWYGFLDTRCPVPAPPPGVMESFASTLREPINHEGDLSAFVEKTAACLPAFRRVADVFRERPPMVLFGDVPTLILAEGEAGRQIIFLRESARPSDIFRDLVVVLSGIAALPEGVAIPPRPLSGDDQTIRKGLWDHFLWVTALTQTFLWQTAWEMHEINLAPPGRGYAGILHARDLSLYRILRRNGLAAVASLLPDFLPAQKRESVERKLARLSRETPQSGTGAAPSATWSPPESGPKPDLPEIFLDEFAEDAAGNQGLYRQTGTLALLPQSQRDEIKKFLAKGLEGDGDIDPILRVMVKLAPVLMSRILEPLERGRVRLEIREARRGEPVSPLHIPLTRLLGIPTPTDEKLIPTIFLTRGSTRIHAILRIVEGLSRTIFEMQGHPSLQLPPMEELTGGVPQIASALELGFAQCLTFGLTGAYEFLDEAAKRGIAVTGNPKEEERRFFLRGWGLETSAEQWRVFVDPGAGKLLESSFERWAVEILAQLSRSDR